MEKKLPSSLEIISTKVTHPHEPSKSVPAFALERLVATADEGSKLDASKLFFIQTKVLLALLGEERELINVNRSLHEQEIVKAIISNITRRIEKENDPEIRGIIEKIRSKLGSMNRENMRREDSEQINLDLDETVIAAFTMALFKEYKFHNVYRYETKDKNDKVTTIPIHDLNNTFYFKEMMIERNWPALEAVLAALQQDMTTFNEKLSGMHKRYKFDLTYQEIWLLAKEIIPYLPKLYILYNILNREELANFNIFGYRSGSTESVRLESFRYWIVQFVAHNTFKKDTPYMDEDASSQHGLSSAKKWLTQVTTNMRNKPSGPRGK